MNMVEFLSTICTIISIAFAAASAFFWGKASGVEMPKKADIPDELPGMGRVMIHGEDYAVTMARLNEGLDRLDNSLDAINLSSKWNAWGSRYAMLAALALSIGLVFSLLDTMAKR